MSTTASAFDRTLVRAARDEGTLILSGAKRSLRETSP